MNFLPGTCLYFALMVVPALACAQQKTRPDPADSKVSVPPVVYATPFRQYHTLGDEAVSSWKTVNEEVEKAGGWKAYLREAQNPAPVPRPSVTPAPQVKPPPKPQAANGSASHTH